MFEDADNYFADIFRGNLPYYLLISLPLLIMCSSNPVLAANEFTIQRMSQFDVHGVPYGCRASALNLEAKSLHSWKTSRHCIVTRFQDLSVEQFREIRTKAGGLIVLLPHAIAALSAEQQQHVFALEQAMLATDITIPVYFARYSAEFDGIIEDITANRAALDGEAASATTAQQRESALAEIVNSVSANGYQIVVTGAVHTPNKNSQIPIIQGELAPQKLLPAATGSSAGSGSASSASSTADLTSKLPLIIITAHLDTFGLTQDPLANVDAAVLLTLIDTFSKLHSSATTAPKYRLQFILSEAGNLLNYQGTKKWIESNWEDSAQSASLQNAEFVLCLDALGHSAASGDSLYMHVSKPPKEGTAINGFFKQLKRAAQLYGGAGNATVDGVHKKINLADVQLAWEHERFSMKRLPAFTVSSLRTHKDAARHSMFRIADGEQQLLGAAQRAAKVVAEALGAYVYGGGVNGGGEERGELFAGATAITAEQVRPWLRLRSQLHNNDVRNAFEKYLRNVRVTFDKPDAREPDFMLYEGHEGTLNFYSVKPAVFDLFLTVAICAYLGVVYLGIVGFPRLYETVSALSAGNYGKVKGN